MTEQCRYQHRHNKHAAKRQRHVNVAHAVVTVVGTSNVLRQHHAQQRRCQRETQAQRVYLVALGVVVGHFAGVRVVRDKHQTLRRSVKHVTDNYQKHFDGHVVGNGRNDVPRKEQCHETNQHKRRGDKHKETAFTQATGRFAVGDFADKRGYYAVPDFGKQQHHRKACHRQPDNKRQKLDKQKIDYVETAAAENVAAGKGNFVAERHLTCRNGCVFFNCFLHKNSLCKKARLADSTRACTIRKHHNLLACFQSVPCNDILQRTRHITAHKIIVFSPLIHASPTPSPQGRRLL